MNNNTYIAVIFLIFFTLMPAGSFAQDRAPANGKTGIEAVDRSHSGSSPAIDIVPGEDGGSIRFVVDGEPVAWLDSEGLHVIGNVEFGGTLTDTGSEALRKTVRNMDGGNE